MALDQALPESLAANVDDAAEEPIDIKMDKRVDLLLALIVVAVGAYVCFTASHFRTGSFPDPLTSRGFPYITGGFMILAGLFSAARRVLTWSSFPGNLVVSEGKEDDPRHISSSSRPYLMMALAAAWCFLVRPAGYLVVTPLMMAGMAWLMGVRSRGKLIGFPLAYTLIVWVVFSQILHIVLPLGPLTSLFRAWGLTP
jgi:hypothetical protein